MDHPHEGEADDTAPAVPTEDELLAVMEQSDSDVALGLTVPLADVLAELDIIANNSKTRRRARPRA